MIPQKKNDKITLKECLAVSSFCSPKAIRSKSDYTLRSVVKHHGKSLASGHYTTDSIRNTNAPGEAVDLDWVHSNDRVCTKISSQDVLNDQNSYLVMYTLNSNMDNEATAVTVTEASSSEERSISTDEESSTDMHVARSDSTPYSSSTIDSDTEESVREVIDLIGNSNADKEIKKQRSRSSSRSKNDERRKRRRSNSTTTSSTEVTEIVDLVKRTKAKSKDKSDVDDDFQMWVRVT